MVPQKAECLDHQAENDERSRQSAVSREWDWFEFALLHRLPVLDVVKVFHVVDGVMASGRHAGELVALDVGHGLRIGRVQGALLKAARALMAVQALTVVVRMVELDGLLRFGDILRVDMVQPLQFGAETAEDGVIGVAGIAGLIAWHTPVLKMRCRNIGRVIYVEALSISAHDMAGQAERRLL